MATRPETAEHLLDALAAAGSMAVKRMFGEYALYCSGSVVGFICDDQLYLKLLPVSRAILPDAELGQPYPGAKDYLLVTEALDDPDPVIAAIRAIAREVPPKEPKPRKARAPKP